MGQSVENENLRQLLQKLQQENRALMQNAFSFKGPMPTMNDLNAGNLQVLQSNPAPSGMSQLEPPLQTIKPPSPPISVHDGRKDSSTSMNSNEGRPSLSVAAGNTSSSPGNMADMTPASTVSKTSSSSSPPGRQASSGSGATFFNPDPYNAFSGGAFAATNEGNLPPAYGMAPQQMPSSSTSPGFPVASGSMAPPATTRQPQQQSQSWIQSSSASDNLANATPFTILSFNPAFTSFRDDTPFGNIGGLGLGQFDYRESKQATVGMADKDLDDPFAELDGMGDDAMEAFLRSLSQSASGAEPGTQAAPTGQTSFSITADGMQVMNPDHSKYYIPPGSDAMDTGSDLLDAYLRDGFSAEVNEKWAMNAASIKSGGSMSSSNMANFGGGVGVGSGNGSGNLLSPTSGTSNNSGFSPSNYFTLSPDATPSTVPSSISRHDSTSSSNSAGGVRKKSTPLAVGTMGSSEPCQEQKILGKDGKLLSPAQVWSKVQERLDFSEGLDIDDLCSELKAKAVCGGVGPAVPESALDKALDEYAASKRATAARTR